MKPGHKAHMAPPGTRESGSRTRRESWLVVLGRQASWFTVIGVASTLGYLVLYELLRGAMSPQPANYVAWAITAIADTAANRRFTFDASCRVSQTRAQVEGLLIFVVALLLTSASLALLDAYVHHPSRVLELTVLVAANFVAGLLRFELLRRWVFAARES
jgi:putative flippase GtrA